MRLGYHAHMSFDKKPFFLSGQITPPKSKVELLARCDALAGKTLGRVAETLGLSVPDDLKVYKGWVGALLETALGADAGNRSEPDFIGLGIEMKTLPLNLLGLPKESTYVCSVSMQQSGELRWQESWLRRKLSHVLWVPVEAVNTIPLAERYIGQPWLWQPSSEQEALLRRDWEELMDRIILGNQSDITAKEGEYLQIRPKAAHSKSLTRDNNQSGKNKLTLPRGFYLRPSFTDSIISYTNY